MRGKGDKIYSEKKKEKERKKLMKERWHALALAWHSPPFSVAQHCLRSWAEGEEGFATLHARCRK